MMQERKKKKIKNQRYSFEVKSEIECWRWIEVLTAATSAVLNEQNKSSAGSQLSPSDSGTLKRSRSTSAPPAMAPPLMRGQSLSAKTAETDEDEDEENDPYADEQSDDDEDDSRPMYHHHHGAAQHKEKEMEPAQRKGLHSVAFAADAQQKDNWAHFQPSGASNTPPGTPMRNVNYAAPATVTFNPFAPASGQQPAQPISPYSAHQVQAQQQSQPQLQQQHSQPQLQQQHSQPQLQQLPPMQPMNHQQAFHIQQQQQHLQQQQQASHSFPHSPVAQSLASPPSSLNHMSPPSSSAAAQHKAADAPKSASAVYITTMSPPAHVRCHSRHNGRLKIRAHTDSLSFVCADAHRARSRTTERHRQRGRAHEPDPVRRAGRSRASGRQAGALPEGCLARGQRSLPNFVRHTTHRRATIAQIDSFPHTYTDSALRSISGA
jgi:hypothetical protein